MKKTFTLLLILLGANSVKAVTTDDPPLVAVPIFQENFDYYVGNTGGNDNLWNGSGPEIISGDYQYKKVFQANQCVRIGVTSNTDGSLTIPNIPLSGRGFITFRAGGWHNAGTIRIGMKYKVDNTINTTSGASITPSTFNFIEIKDEIIAEKNLILTFYPADKSNKPINKKPIFLDDICVYQAYEPTPEIICNAERILLCGTYDEQAWETLLEGLKENEKITFVDVTRANLPEGAEIKTGNPNCLFYDSKPQKLVNTINTVSNGVCKKLLLKEGHPFDNVRDFKATDVSYDRTFTPGRWSSVCLPFTVKEQDAPSVIINQLGNDGYNPETGALTFSESTTITSTKPRIIKSSIAQPFVNLTGINAEVKGTTPWVKALYEGDVQLGGTYQELEGTSNADVYTYGLSGGKFTANKNGRFGPFRSYLKIKTAILPDMDGRYDLSTNLVDDLPTGLTPATQTDNPVTVYDLQGKPVCRDKKWTELKGVLTPGIYIINGKKIIF